jgi:PAS domain-containing protein
MLENIKRIAFWLDLEGCITFCNDFLLQITDYTRDEVLGCDWFAQFVSDVRMRSDSLIWSLSSGLIGHTIAQHGNGGV